MKCLYYLAPTLESTRAVSDDLHRVGIKDWFIHVVSNDEAGLKRERIHSSNYVETLDFVRTGLLGAYIGFFVGMFGAFLIMATQTFGSKTPVSTYDKNFISPFGEVSRIAEAAVTLGAKLR